MKHSVSLTIGIPAYNESTALVALLKSVIVQVQSRYVLKKIIVVSDGSTDNTVEQIEKLNIPYLSIKKFSQRKGKAHALSYIQKQTETDALLLLDADVSIKDLNFIDSLIQPIQEGFAELTSACVVPKPAKNFFTKMLYVSNNFKQALYEGWNDGNNIYTCHGRAICIAKKLYSEITYDDIIADDALAYLTAQKLKLHYQYVSTAKVYYLLPQTPEDHYKQSSRFLISQKQFNSIFKYDLITQSYTIPSMIVIQTAIIYFFKNPIEMLLYVFTFTYMKIKTINEKKFVSIWEISQSSKT